MSLARNLCAAWVAHQRQCGLDYAARAHVPPEPSAIFHALAEALQRAHAEAEHAKGRTLSERADELTRIVRGRGDELR